VSGPGQLGGNDAWDGARLLLAGEARGRIMGDVRPAKQFDVVGDMNSCMEDGREWEREVVRGEEIILVA